jgi:hypothetical protein
MLLKLTSKNEYLTFLLQKVNADFSKHKLQTKAKLSSLNQQLEQAQKAASEAAEKVT